MQSASRDKLPQVKERIITAIIPFTIHPQRKVVQKGKEHIDKESDQYLLYPYSKDPAV